MIDSRPRVVRILVVVVQGVKGGSCFSLRPRSARGLRASGGATCSSGKHRRPRGRSLCRYGHCRPLCDWSHNRRNTRRRRHGRLRSGCIRSRRRWSCMGCLQHSEPLLRLRVLRLHAQHRLQLSRSRLCLAEQLQRPGPAQQDLHEEPPPGALDGVAVAEARPGHAAAHGRQELLEPARLKLPLQLLLLPLVLELPLLLVLLELVGVLLRLADGLGAGPLPRVVLVDRDLDLLADQEWLPRV
mmetsp:Transcript_73295/g.218747  ORF Transcript_73295/g.218747 Transcript_73295/m.218747 type:complete len:242 (-) Transcript_73295:949-1674(-)